MTRSSSRPSRAHDDQDTPAAAPPRRRMGQADSEVRARFVDAAEALLAEEGDAGVSARTVAARAGLKTQLIYYYFRNMDDLLLEVVRRVHERRHQRFEEALRGPEPLRAMWEHLMDPTTAALGAVFTAMAFRRPAIRAEIVRAGQAFRALQTQAVAQLMPPVPPGSALTAGGCVMIAAALGRMLANEQSLGLDYGHAEALRIIDALLGGVDGHGAVGATPG